MRNSTVTATVSSLNVAATDDNGASGGALELDGTATIENVRDHGQQHDGDERAGNAAAVGALQFFGQAAPSQLVHALVSGNTVSASSSDDGAATVQGAGVVNNGLLELRNVRVTDNSATATGPAGFAQGGGIWNGTLFNPPPRAAHPRRHGRDAELDRREPRPRRPGGGLFSEFP